MYEPELEQYLEQCRALVARETFMVNLNDKGLLPYAYTIGLSPLLNCELVVVGQDEQASRIVLNEMAGQMLTVGGEMPDGLVYEGESCTNLKLAPLQLDETLMLMFSMVPALGYMPAQFRQVLVSTAESLFPDQAGYSGAIQDIDCCVRRRPTQLH